MTKPVGAWAWMGTQVRLRAVTHLPARASPLPQTLTLVNRRRPLHTAAAVLNAYYSVRVGRNTRVHTAQ